MKSELKPPTSEIKQQLSAAQPQLLAAQQQLSATQQQLSVAEPKILVTEPQLSAAKPTISVVIPTYNRAEDLDACLESIRTQTKTPKEIIIVDDSDDSSVEDLVTSKKDGMLGKWIDLKYFRNQGEKNICVARNRGIEKANGEIILFLDSDVVLDDSYIEEISAVYEKHPEALGVQGFIKNVNTSKMYNTISKIFYFSFLEDDRCRMLPSTEFTYPINLNEVINADVLSGSNMSLKKEILQEVRFDERLQKYTYKEDEDLSASIIRRYPKTLFMTPHAKLIHKVSAKGRIPLKNSSYIKQIHTYYLFHKHIDQTIGNKIIFLWSRLGYMMFYMATFALKPSRSRWLRLKYLVEAYQLCLTNRKRIEAGDLRFLNDAEQA